MMTDLQAIDARCSRRAYAGPLPPSAVAPLRDLAGQLAETHGIDILLAKDAPTIFGGLSRGLGMFRGVHSFFVLSGEQQDAGRFETCGHAGQRVVLELTKLGFGSCWLTGTFNKPAVAKLVTGENELVAVIAAGPVEQGLHRRERLIRKATHKQEQQTTNYTADTQPPLWFLAGAQAADKAPSAMNQKPVRFAYEDGTATARVEKETDNTLIDLGIAKLHFELAAQGVFGRGNGAAFQQNDT